MPGLVAVQSAILNILEDSAGERAQLEMTQHATINLLEDIAADQGRLGGLQRAMLNVLDDAAEEKGQLQSAQRAMLNLVDDFEDEKFKVEHANRNLEREIATRTRAEELLRKANEASDVANKELETFSYSVAHDLRAPLRSIDGFGQALLEDNAAQLDEQGQEYLGYIRASTQHMARLIDDLLGLSRVSRSELRQQEVDLSEITRAIAVDLSREHPDRSVTWIVPPTMKVLGDHGLLDALLDNLIRNAWKFTGKRKQATIELGTLKDAERVVHFVRDNGEGFDMAFADKLFGVFQRLHKASEFEGTGIGLATVQRIVRRHGGRVWAEGVVGQGATLYFTLWENM
jgi:light-regulated signal transduction histidine kinase (bacteriophytochrome)